MTRNPYSSAKKSPQVTHPHTQRNTHQSTKHKTKQKKPMTRGRERDGLPQQHAGGVEAGGEKEQRGGEVNRPSGQPLVA